MYYMIKKSFNFFPIRSCQYDYLTQKCYFSKQSNRTQRIVETSSYDYFQKTKFNLENGRKISFFII